MLRYLRLVLPLTLLALAGIARAGEAPTAAGADPIPAALAEAKQRQALVLVDFHAPWCYSCYFMAQHVTNGPEWDKVGKQAIIVDMDADSPAGAHWMDQWQIKALPAYMVLKADGKELGRILGEQTRPVFYQKLGDIMSAGNTLDQLETDAVRADGKVDAAAAADVLAAYHARHDVAGGMAWFHSLPATAQDKLSDDGSIAFWLERLALMQAADSDDAAACATHGASVLSSSQLGCDRAYELDRVMGCTAKLPAAQRQGLLQDQRQRYDSFLDHRIFTEPETCADVRSSVLVGADLDKALGDDKAADALLDKVIAMTEKKLGGDLSSDRNLADNLRVYLMYGDRTDALDALMPKLIAAWPDDYVYPYRFGVSLMQRERYADALPWLEKAATKAYGINRLHVAEKRVTALKALHRDQDAKRVAIEALKANGPWFPEEAAKLKAMI